ncbi:MAG: M12 family metallo-peptidase [Phycisphaerales bacterium]
MRTLLAAIANCVAGSTLSIIPIAVVGTMSFTAHAQQATALRSGEQHWTSLAAMPPQVVAGREWVRPAIYRAYQLDFASIRQFLATAPLEFSGRQRLMIALPNPKGEFSYFEIAESPIVHPDLGAWMSAQGAEVRTFVGQGLDDPTATIRLDYTSQGFHAQVLGAAGDWSIDPFTFADTTHYVSYDIDDLVAREGWTCHLGPDNSPPEIENPFLDRATGTTLRTYDMAVAAVPTYTNFHGGTVTGAQAAIVTMVNRVNQIYERDFCMRFQLVANNQNLIYTTANPGPYTDGTLSSMLDENQANINAVIGSANYDIGHVVSGLNLGGLAQRPAICGTGKARGGTGLSSPTGDFFTVKYVGHEVGHQCNASHSFNADDSAGNNTCLPNRSSAAAYEPGSGSTIMSYQGLCGAANNLTNWDTMFNQGAYANVDGYINGTGNCGTNTATGNSLPVITPLFGYVIPIGTAFSATAVATDSNGDAMTFSWEQRNLGPAQPETGAGSEDNGTSPLFRVFAPTTDPTRIFPRYVDVLDGSVQIGEQYPAVGRTLSLRCLVRDNRAGGGAVRTADVNYTVVGTAGPFRINVLNTTGSTVGPNTYNLTWDVANTNVPPVNTASVRILLSIDGGTTWPYTLETSTPNDGSQVVNLPPVTSTTARFRIEPTNSVYFDVNDANFSIACPDVSDVSATDSTLCDRVTITWTPVVGATSYRVFRNTTNNFATSTPIASGVTTTTYNDTTASPGLQYWYWVRIISGQCSTGGPSGTGDQGRREATTSITLNPSNQTIPQGQNASFNVIATGGSLAYQWQRNNVNLPADPRYTGINSPTLGISNAQTGDQGTYRCVVTGFCGAAQNSGGATLTVTTGPTCDGIDFNNDSSLFDPVDIDAFLSVYGEGPCIPSGATCNDIDFNNDGSLFDPCDIDSFLLVFSEGPCTPCGV